MATAIANPTESKSPAAGHFIQAAFAGQTPRHGNTCVCHSRFFDLLYATDITFRLSIEATLVLLAVCPLPLFIALSFKYPRLWIYSFFHGVACLSH
jgi:hypothetical protein